MKRIISTYISWLMLSALAVCGQTFQIPSFGNRGLAYDRTTSIDLHQTGSISSMKLYGECEFGDSASLALFRAILVTEDGQEFLLAESENFTNTGRAVTFSGESAETEFLTAVRPGSLKIVLVNALVRIDSVKCERGDGKRSASDLSQRRARKIATAVQRYNDVISDKGLLWRPGTTEMSNMSYSEKKSMLYGGSDSCYLYGLEYYRGGIFSFGMNIDRSRAAMQSNYVSKFDWQCRHGVNWNTKVKNQTSPPQPNGIGNGGCWAFAPIGMAESYANIYYNQKIDLDLSEQDVISCCSWGSCAHGGNPERALDYIIANGAISEPCFPFVNIDADCSDKCTSPVVMFSGGVANTKYYNSCTEDSLKHYIINNGPLTAILHNVAGTSHALILEGYGVVKAGDNVSFFAEQTNEVPIDVPQNSPFIGQTYWIFKNSYGTSRYVNGYLYCILDDITRIPSIQWLTGRPEVYGCDSVVCQDLDGDGYYNWGIGPKPEYCPQCPDLPDGNDYNPNIGGMDSYGKSLYLGSNTAAPYIKGEDVVGCSGSYAVMNIPEDVEVAWSLSNGSASPLSIVGTNGEAMVRVVQKVAFGIGGFSNPLTGQATLTAAFVSNSVPFTLSKTIDVVGEYVPFIDQSAYSMTMVGQEVTFFEENCANLPDQYLRWSVYVPGVGNSVQYGHSVAVRPSTTGTIRITVTNLLACSSNSASCSITNSVFRLHNPVLLMNNPANDILNVEVRDIDPDLRYRVEINNSQGLMMERYEISKSFSVNTAVYLPGSYSLSLYQGDNLVEIQHFIVQH